MIPLLQHGERLTRVEFERRYGAMPQVKKTELIEGIVYLPSRVPLIRHSQPHAILVGWIGYYCSKTIGLLFGDSATNRLDRSNEPQPDVMLLLPAHMGGTAKVDQDDYVNGPPEFVGEVAASSASIDLHAKMNAYRRNGVKEYLVWRTEEKGIDWFILRDGTFQPLPVGQDGIIRSETFPGLWLDPAAMLDGKLPRLFEVIDLGTASEAHVAFARKLQQ